MFMHSRGQSQQVSKALYWLLDLVLWEPLDNSGQVLQFGSLPRFQCLPTIVVLHFVWL